MISTSPNLFRFHDHVRNCYIPHAKITWFFFYLFFLFFAFNIIFLPTNKNNTELKCLGNYRKGGCLHKKIEKRFQRLVFARESIPGEELRNTDELSRRLCDRLRNTYIGLSSTEEVGFWIYKWNKNSCHKIVQMRDKYSLTGEVYGRSNGSSSKGESSFYETKLKKVIITFPKETFCHHYFEYNKRNPPGKLTKTIQWMLQVNWWRATRWVLLTGSSFNTFLVAHTFVWIHNFVFKSPCQPWELGQRIELFLRHPTIKKANQNKKTRQKRYNK